MSTVITPKMVANNVRAWRTHLGFKQHVIADELGVRREWYVKMENGQADLKVTHLLIIARVLEVAPAEFLKESTEFDQQKSAPPENKHNLDQIIEGKVFSLFTKIMGSLEASSNSGELP